MTTDLTWNFTALGEAIDSTPTDVCDLLSYSGNEIDIPLTSATHKELLDFNQLFGAKSRAKGAIKKWRIDERRSDFLNGLIDRINQALTSASRNAHMSMAEIIKSGVLYSEFDGSDHGRSPYVGSAMDFQMFDSEHHALTFICELHNASQIDQENMLLHLQVRSLGFDADIEHSAYRDLYDALKQRSILETKIDRNSILLKLLNAMNKECARLLEHESVKSIITNSLWRAEELPIHLTSKLDPRVLSRHSSSLRSIAKWMERPGEFVAHSVPNKELEKVRHQWKIHEDARLCFLLLHRWIEFLLLLFSDHYCDICWRHSGVSKRCTVHTALGHIPVNVRLAKLSMPIFLKITETRLSSHRLRLLIYGSALPTDVAFDHIQAIKETGVSQEKVAITLAQLFLDVRAIFPALAEPYSVGRQRMDEANSLAYAASQLFMGIFCATVAACDSIVLRSADESDGKERLDTFLKAVNLRLFFKLWFGFMKWPSGHVTQVVGLGHDVSHPVIKSPLYDIRRCVFDIARERAWWRSVELVLSTCTPEAVKQIAPNLEMPPEFTDWTSRSARYERRMRSKHSAKRNPRLRSNSLLLDEMVRLALAIEESVLERHKFPYPPPESIDLPKIDFKIDSQSSSLGYWCFSDRKLAISMMSKLSPGYFI